MRNVQRLVIMTYLQVKGNRNYPSQFLQVFIGLLEDHVAYGIYVLLPHLTHSTCSLHVRIVLIGKVTSSIFQLLTIVFIILSFTC